MNVELVQKQIDELMEAYDYDSVKTLIIQALSEASATGDNASMLTLTNEYLGFLRKTEAFGEVDIIVERLLKLLDAMGLVGSIPYATSLINIANTYRFAGNPEASIEYFENALPIMRSTNKTYDVAYIYSCLANLYFETADYGKAKENALLAKESYELVNPCDLSLASALYILGLIYNNEANPQAAKAVLNESLKIIGNEKNEFYYRVMDELKRTPEGYAGTVSELKEAYEPFTSGMALARAYYEECLLPILESELPEYLDKIAVGLVGRGSECYGFDDKSSMDHDWGPGLCVWVTKETYSKIGMKLDKIYKNLPKEFRGFSFAANITKHKRKGVFIIEDFFKELLGIWPINGNYALIPDYSMSTAVNGEIFVDKEGEFTRIYNELKKGYPDGFLYKKLAEAASKFSQAAQYNAKRMLKRNDTVTASIMLADGIKEYMRLAHLVERKYPPHDKWLFKSLSLLENGEDYQTLIKDAMNTGDVSKLSHLLALKMYKMGYISDSDDYLDHHADELLFKSDYVELSDEALVEKIVELEYIAFDKVKNEGGRADCQDDFDTFSIMRRSQYLNWNHAMLLQYYYDFYREYHLGHNLITEKYGRMMESTAPKRYEEIKESFPYISPEKKSIIEAIVAIQVKWMEAFCKEYPKLGMRSRSVRSSEDNLFNTSYETYLRGEISTYSDKMLELYGRFISKLEKEGKNLAYMTMGISASLYGYNSLKEAEEKA